MGPRKLWLSREGVPGFSAGSHLNRSKRQHHRAVADRGGMEATRAFVYSKWRGANLSLLTKEETRLVQACTLMLILVHLIRRRGAATLGATFLYMMAPGPVQQVCELLEAQPATCSILPPAVLEVPLCRFDAYLRAPGNGLRRLCERQEDQGEHRRPPGGQRAAGPTSTDNAYWGVFRRIFPALLSSLSSQWRRSSQPSVPAAGTWREATSV